MFIELLTSSALAIIALLSALLMFILSPRLVNMLGLAEKKADVSVQEIVNQRLWVRLLELFACQVLVALFLYVSLYFFGVITLSLPLLLGCVLLLAFLLSCLLSAYI